MAEMEVEPMDYATTEKDDNLDKNYDNIPASSDDDSNGSWNAEDGHPKSKLNIQREGALFEDAMDFEGEMYVRDSNHCLETFPEEVWMLIAEVSAPTTLENLSNSSPFFRRLLLPQRVNFLFPSVWKILAVKFHEERKKPEEDSDLDSDDEENDDEEVDDDQEENFWAALARPRNSKNTRRQCSCGRVGRARWYSDILTLRLVSKKWADTIDHFYQNQPYYFSIPDNCKDLIATSSCWADTTFHTGTTQHSFLHHFNQTHGTGNEERSPFLSRRCEIFHRDNDHAEEDIFPDMSRLLEKYGHHIWYASIRLTRITGTLTEWYSRLRSLLAGMPNLKGLRITYNYEGDAYREHLGQCQLITEVFLNSLPTLEHLRLLKTQQLPAAVFNEIIRRNGHISKLEVEQKPKSDPEIYKMPLPNLKDLNLTFISEEEIPKLQRSTEKWPLEKLTLDFTARFHLEWSKLFTLLETKWGSTLTDLDLSLPNNHPGTCNGILNDCPSNRLNLPEVKCLKVSIENVSSLDFILPMKETLEYLEVTALYEVPVGSKLYQKVRNEQVVQFLGYDERLLESNIWTLFPKLQRLVLKKDDPSNNDNKVEHTRLEWRKEMERKLMMEQEKRREIAVQTDNIWFFY